VTGNKKVWKELRLSAADTDVLVCHEKGDIEEGEQERIRWASLVPSKERSPWRGVTLVREPRSEEEKTNWEATNAV